MLTKLINDRIRKIVVDLLGNTVVELDPKKNYILVIPSNVSMEELQRNFKEMNLKTNIVSIHSNNVRIIELD